MSLSGEQLQQVARDTAGSLAGVSHGRPFTPHLDVWKVADKVFLVVTDDDPDAQIITVKVDPHHGETLRRDHETITAGRYFNKRHWVSVGAGRGITKHVVEDLVLGSYELVADHLPTKDRPA
ncbi:MmcQ/YjbR family DNA-binding protein [Georgenia sp. TF02-10]|uniref:MmcQ/YjbR family DNA-binding protein n=1 Tax=Georgenia sp. TF02-10 TaxID=2917725 RepID=UPI001FA7C368|nr:MmcQ/YjbR family DNA-binding protein [Georgenia sp. TF02-10]UNX54165.1 MmcQ/YjbR family DNA-binding protein [Georgenia sp. TF02-10]